MRKACMMAEHSSQRGSTRPLPSNLLPPNGSVTSWSRSVLSGAKNKTAINPFQEGVDLVSRAHKMGTYFGYSNRQNELEQVCKELGDVATVRIQVDFNSTRIAAVHGLLYSEIRLNRGLLDQIDGAHETQGADDAID